MASAETELSGLSKYDPKMTDFVEAWTEIENHPARSSVITAARYLEDALEFSIRQRLLETLDEPYLDRLFAKNGKLHSFSAKIKKGHAENLYDSVIKDDLEIVLRIRNCFAHSPRAISFETTEIATEISRLNYLKIQRTKQDVSVNEIDPRSIFLDTVRILLLDVTAGAFA